MNKRRKLVIALGVSALTAPLVSFAQQLARIGRIGFLSPYRSDNDLRFEAIR